MVKKSSKSIPPIFKGLRLMDPKKKVKDILNEAAGKDKIEIKKFIRFKVGEGV